jgi:dipeptide/tripeptide permease
MAAAFEINYRGENMISTIIPVTANIATSGTVMPGAFSVSGTGLLATLTLFILLIAKELAGAAPENCITQAVFIDRILNIGVIPLTIVFFSIVLFETIKLI